MDADLDLLLTTVFCTADDLLPERAKNARRRVTDAEVVTLCVAQAIMGIPSDRRFLAVARKRLVRHETERTTFLIGSDRVVRRVMRGVDPASHDRRVLDALE
jgi:hypothetical protein